MSLLFVKGNNMSKFIMNDIAIIKLGLNFSRLSKEEKEGLTVYTNTDLLNDLNGFNQIDIKKTRSDSIDFSTHTVCAGDIVYSFINSICGIVGDNNSGKTINQNFAKIELKSASIDKKYLCYLLNKDKEIELEKKIAMQGSVLKKLSPASIRNFNVELPDIKRQTEIGNLYFDWMKRQALIKRQYELEDTIFSEFLNELKNK